MNCKCGHYQYAHDFGKGKCVLIECKCKKYREKKAPKQIMALRR